VHELYQASNELSDRSRFWRQTQVVKYVSPERHIPALKAIGYQGFRYDGGLLVGGLGRHDAYSMWDADFVNSHRVERFK
jgi:hypothetical protein